jgi:hypothetical protein
MQPMENNDQSQKTRMKSIEDIMAYAVDWFKDKIDFFVEANLVHFQPENNEDIWPYNNPFIVNLVGWRKLCGP